MTRHFILYGTYGCHLCEQAHAMVDPVLQSRGATLEEVDILDDQTLEARYGVSIPVLKDSGSDRELAWPFDLSALEAFLSR